MSKFSTKQTGLLATSELGTFKGKAIYWSFFFIFVIASVVAIVPTLWTVASAFKDTKEIYASFTFFPKNLTWKKAGLRIVESWQYLQFGKSFINTVILALGCWLIRIISVGFGGYALSKLKLKSSQLILVLIVWTMMMPAQIRIVPNFMTILNFPFASDYLPGLNLMDTFWPMWLHALSSPFSVLLFKNSFDALSDSYIEAARIDGCSEFGTFFKIMFPLAMPVIIYESINVLIGVWSDYFSPLLYLDQRVVVPLQLYRLKYDAALELNTYFMALVFASVPTFLIYAIFQKQIMGGINIGGVKG